MMAPCGSSRDAITPAGLRDGTCSGLSQAMVLEKETGASPPPTGQPPKTVGQGPRGTCLRAPGVSIVKVVHRRLSAASLKHERGVGPGRQKRQEIPPYCRFSFFRELPPQVASFFREPPCDGPGRAGHPGAPDLTSTAML